MKYTYIVLLAFLGIFACKKDTPIVIVTTPVVEQKSCILEESNFKIDSTVQIWLVTDTSKGKASAIKVWKNWEAKVNSNYFNGNLLISFYTYYYKKDFRRAEVVYFSNVPSKIGCYELKKKSVPNGTLTFKYFVCDEDIIINTYTLDENRAKNYLEITKIDTLNKIIEGKFMATFLRDTSYKKLVYIQDTVRFANGSFWAKIQ